MADTHTVQPDAESKADPRTFSFAVGSQHARRSARWIVTVSGAGAYVSTSKDRRRRWHASLHASGRWHIKGLGKQYPSAAPLVKSHRSNAPASAREAWDFINLIPDASLRQASSPEPQHTRRPNRCFDLPESEGMVERTVMTWRFEEIEPVEQWPGESQGTQLVRFYQFFEQGGFGVLLRYFTKDHPVGMNLLRGGGTAGVCPEDEADRSRFA